jgi:hypothetical protein
LRREDFRDALRLAVLSLAKRFNRKLDEADLNDYVDDLMWELSPKLLAQLPALLLEHRRNGLFFPSTGEIREKIVRPLLPAARDFIPYSYPQHVLGMLPAEAREALESSRKTQGRREKIPEAELRLLTDSIKAEARKRRKVEEKEREAGEHQGKTWKPLGEGMTEEAFRQLIDTQKKDFLEYNKKEKGRP